MSDVEELALAELELDASRQEADALAQKVAAHGYLGGRREALEAAEARVRVYESEVLRIEEAIASRPSGWGSW